MADRQAVGGLGLDLLVGAGGLPAGVVAGSWLGAGVGSSDGAAQRSCAWVRRGRGFAVRMGVLAGLRFGEIYGFQGVTC